jgi:hypothetical protein
VVLQDRYGNAIDLDLRLGQLVKFVDALPQAAEMVIDIPDASDVVAVYYENLFGLLYETKLEEAGNRFRMTARKTWPWHNVPEGVRRELPNHWWRR